MLPFVFTLRVFYAFLPVYSSPEQFAPYNFRFNTFWLAALHYANPYLHRVFLWQWFNMSNITNICESFSIVSEDKPSSQLFESKVLSSSGENRFVLTDDGKSPDRYY
jgi:hypothetical protein